MSDSKLLSNTTHPSLSFDVAFNMVLVVCSLNHICFGQPNIAAYKPPSDIFVSPGAPETKIVLGDIQRVVTFICFCTLLRKDKSFVQR